MIEFKLDHLPCEIGKPVADDEEVTWDDFSGCDALLILTLRFLLTKLL